MATKYIFVLLHALLCLGSLSSVYASGHPRNQVLDWNDALFDIRSTVGSINSGKKGAMQSQDVPSESPTPKCILDVVSYMRRQQAESAVPINMKKRSWDSSPQFLPEDIILLFPHIQQDIPAQKFAIQCIGELLPISHLGMTYNRRITYRGKSRDKTNPIREILNVTSSDMMRVANLLRDAQFPSLALGVYVESGYMESSPPLLGKSFSDTWLSPKAAVYWAKAAECARLAGKTELGWGYLMKAAVFGDEKTYQAALKTAKQWELEDKNPPKKPNPKPVDPKVRREALTEVVRLYAKMNAHPRAWELIDAYPDAFENPKALKKEIQNEWLAVVKDVSRVAKKVVLYGQEVHPNGDPLKVKIPQAMSDEAIKKVNQKLKEFLSKQAETKPVEKSSPTKETPVEKE
jgi:hypothetical protein